MLTINLCKYGSNKQSDNTGLNFYAI